VDSLTFTQDGVSGQVRTAESFPIFHWIWGWMGPESFCAFCCPCWGGK